MNSACKCLVFTNKEKKKVLLSIANQIIHLYSELNKPSKYHRSPDLHQIAYFLTQYEFWPGIMVT